MKKIISMLLAMLLVMTFVGCGTDTIKKDVSNKNFDASDGVTISEFENQWLEYIDDLREFTPTYNKLNISENINDWNKNISDDGLEYSYATACHFGEDILENRAVMRFTIVTFPKSDIIREVAVRLSWFDEGVLKYLDDISTFYDLAYLNVAKILNPTASDEDRLKAVQLSSISDANLAYISDPIIPGLKLFNCSSEIGYNYIVIVTDFV